MTSNKREIKGAVLPFRMNLSFGYKIIVFLSFLIFNLLIVNIIDFFDFEKNFKVPGIENDIKDNFIFFWIFFGFAVPILEEFIFRFWIFEKIIKLIPSLLILALYLILVDYN